MKRNQKKEQTIPAALCEKCGTPLTNTEMRAFREGLYGIDPAKDKRKMCFACKEIDDCERMTDEI